MSGVNTGTTRCGTIGFDAVAYRPEDNAMNRKFSQTMTVRCNNPEKLIEMSMQWDLEQAMSDITGYVGMRLLADREDPGRYLMIADFGAIDPEVSAAEEALRHEERPETQASAALLAELVEGEIEYHNYDELYRTDR